MKADNRATREDVQACATGLAAIAMTSAVRPTRIQMAFGRAGPMCAGTKRRSNRWPMAAVARNTPADTNEVLNGSRVKPRTTALNPLNSGGAI